MKTLAVATIVKNEANHIEEFFETVAGLADELVLVDTGSDDATVAITEKLIRKPWPFRIKFLKKTFTPFHFGKAKNFAIDQCDSDYIFVLDADERVREPFKKQIREVLGDDVIRVRRVDDLVPNYIDYQLRLFKNHCGIRYSEAEECRTEEALEFTEHVKEFSEPIYHLQAGAHQAQRLSTWRERSAIDIAKTPKKDGTFRELVRVPLAFYYIFKKIYISRQAWKDGYRGFRYALIRAYYKAFVQLHVALK